MEELIFGGAYLGREIFVSKSIRLALKLEVNLPLCFSYFLFEGNFPSTSPPGAYICRGDLTEGFLHYRLGGLYIWRGLFSEFYGNCVIIQSVYLFCCMLFRVRMDFWIQNSRLFLDFFSKAIISFSRLEINK